MTCLGTEGRIEKSIEVRDRGTEEEKPGINLGMFTSGKRGKTEYFLTFHVLIGKQVFSSQIITCGLVFVLSLRCI